MFRSLISIAILFGFIRPPQPSIIPNTEHNLYFPLSINNYPFIELINLGHIYTNYGHTTFEDCAYGYTTALSPSAVYSATLAIDVMDYSLSTVYYTNFISPTLEATFLDQKNPLSHCITSSVFDLRRLGDVRMVSASLNPQIDRVIYPLTVTSWMKEDTEWETTVSGNVRNDSGHRLAEIRVVGIAGICQAYEAALGSTILEPSGETSFIFNNFYCCQPEMVEISAQGVADP